MVKEPLLAMIELDQSNRSFVDQYTAVYVLNAVKRGVVSVQFEAHSDGGSSEARSSKKSSGNYIIQSGVKDIQIYGPLRVQPKYIELIRGAQYQVTVSGGPISEDASTSYEVVSVEQKSNRNHLFFLTPFE